VGVGFSLRLRHGWQSLNLNWEEPPALFGDQSMILESNFDINQRGVNSKPHLLGWNGVTLNYRSLQLQLTLKP
jgi:hypothetical protein